MIKIPKYGTFKYSIAKYGKYDLTSGTHVNQSTKYRLRSNTSDNIILNSIRIPSTKAVDVRLRTNAGDFVYTQSIEIKDSPPAIRIRSHSGKESSPWVVSVIGTIKSK